MNFVEFFEKTPFELRTPEGWVKYLTLTSTPGIYNPDFLQDLGISALKSYALAMRKGDKGEANYCLGTAVYTMKLWADQTKGER